MKKPTEPRRPRLDPVPLRHRKEIRKEFIEEGVSLSQIVKGFEDRGLSTDSVFTIIESIPYSDDVGVYWAWEVVVECMDYEAQIARHAAKVVKYKGDLAQWEIRHAEWRAEYAKWKEINDKKELASLEKEVEKLRSKING